jgi:hypothetical protein
MNKLDDLNQPVRANRDFFIPLELTMPQEDMDALQQGIIEQLRLQHKQSRRLWFNSSFAIGHKFDASRKVIDNFLNPMGLKAEVMGVFTVNANTYDRNIHSDAGKLETRFSFYEGSIAPGVIRWFPDTGNGYDYYDTNLDGVKVLDYTWPWVVDFKSRKIDWDDLPLPVWSTSTNCPSALVRTNLPHHVIQGPGLRITLAARVVDLETGSTTGTWSKIKI